MEIDAWKERIASIAAPEAERLMLCALEFLDSEHAGTANKLGWSELELFGMFGGDLAIAARRGDVLGLIPGIILPGGHTYTIIAIEPTRAELKTNGGARLYHRRALAEARLAVPFWDHPAFKARKVKSAGL